MEFSIVLELSKLPTIIWKIGKKKITDQPLNGNLIVLLKLIMLGKNLQLITLEFQIQLMILVILLKTISLNKPICVNLSELLLLEENSLKLLLNSKIFLLKFQILLIAQEILNNLKFVLLLEDLYFKTILGICYQMVLL